MPTDLTILYCRDTRHLVEHVGARLRGTNRVVETVCLSDLQFPLRPSQIQSFGKSRVILIFVSAQLLEFLSRKPNESFGIGYLLKAPSTIAAICQGVSEADVLESHKESLVTYDKWQKLIFHRETEVEYGRLVRTVMKKMCEFNTQPADKVELPEDDVLLIPDTGNNEGQKCFYLIFRKHVGDLDKVTILLRGVDVTESVTMTKINPYTLYYEIPKKCFEANNALEVQILLDRKCIWRQEMQWRVIQTASNQLSTVHSDERRKRETYESIGNGSELNLCSKYGLGEFGIKCNKEDSPTEMIQGVKSPYILMDEAIEIVDGDEKRSSNEYLQPGQVLLRSKSIASSTENRKRLRRESLSLPSLLSPTIETKSYLDFWVEASEDICYLDMSGRHQDVESQDCKPHEAFLVGTSTLTTDKPRQYHSMMSNDYVSMKLHDEAPSKSEDDREDSVESELSECQQELVELLHAFKRGVKTISEVENLFQDWHSRHQDTLKEEANFVRPAPMKLLQRGPSFGLFDLKGLFTKPKRKESKEHVVNQNRQPQDPRTNVQDRQLKSLSKLSNSSTSSGCSGVSERSEALGGSGKTNDSSSDVSVRKKSVSSDRSVIPIVTPTLKFDHSDEATDAEPTPPSPPIRPPPTSIPDSGIKYFTKKEQKPPIFQRSRKKLPKERPISPDYVTPNAVGAEYAALDLASPPEWKKNPTFLQPPDILAKRWVPTSRSETRKASVPEKFNHGLHSDPKFIRDVSALHEIIENNLLHPFPAIGTGRLRRSLSHPQIPVYMELS